MEYKASSLCVRAFFFPKSRQLHFEIPDVSLKRVDPATCLRKTARPPNGWSVDEARIGGTTGTEMRKGTCTVGAALRMRGVCRLMFKRSSCPGKAILLIRASSSCRALWMRAWRSDTIGDSSISCSRRFARSLSFLRMQALLY